MDIFANLFAGLGLFFIGIRLIGNNLKQLAGRRMRQLISKAVAGRSSVALFGLAAGAIMQSMNAVTYVLVAMVTAGAIDKRRALPVINWANIGISILVVLASINLHVLALLLAGLAGLAYYLNLDQSARYRHGVGALMGIGLLFLGIDFIKHASAILKAAPWLKDSLAATAAYPLVGFAIGALAALVV
jgi:phosphate:Na+ symporter